MVKVTDYAIIQRDENNEARVYFSGNIPEDAPKERNLAARVYTESENLCITDFTPCKVEGDKWEIEFTLPAGGLYTFEVRMTWPENSDPHDGHRIAIVRHFGIGDLYILTGQSNMAGYGRDVISDPPVLGVHLYKNNGTWDLASHPLNDSVGTIYPENKEFTNLTSPALSFGRYLKEKLNVPIGLITASLGGSPLSMWHPEEEGSLYRGMMRRIPVTGKVKGILWYQGCFEAFFPDEDPSTYYGRYKRMVELYRKELGDIPFITVQLNKWTGNRTNDIEEKTRMNRRWGMVREAQRKLSEDVKDLYVVPSLDLQLSDGVHNTSNANVVIGQRMALCALKYIYNMPHLGQSAPIPRSASYKDEKHFCLNCDKGFTLFTMETRADGIHVEDETGLIPCIHAYGAGSSLDIETERPYKLPAKVHVYWESYLPAVMSRDRNGQPIMACYGMEIEKKD